MLKRAMTRLILIGLGTLSVTLIFSTALVVYEICDHTLGMIVAGLVMLLIGVLWWLLP